MTHRRRSLRMAALVGILTVIAAVFVWVATDTGAGNIRYKAPY